MDKLLTHWFERQIPAYLEGTLSARKRRRFERHLRKSGTLRRELRAYQRLMEMVAQPQEIVYPSAYAWEQFLPRLHERIEKDYVFRARPKSVWWQWGLIGMGVAEVVAAISLVVMGIGIGRHQATLAQTEAPQVVGATSQEAEKPVGDTVEVIANIWVSPKLAHSLASLDPDPAVHSPVPIPDPNVAKADPDAENGRLSDAEAGYRSLMERSLSPAGLYGEEAAYLMVSSR